MRDIGPRVIEAWIADLQQHGYTANTIAGRVSAVSAFYRWCVREQRIDRSVFVVVYFGLTFAAHGMALVSSDDLPAPMGWLAVVLGGVSFVAGSFQLIGGITVISIATFAAAWSLSSLWLVAVGAMVLRRTTDRAAAGDSVRP